MAGATLQVLTWNLFHGRAVPGAGRHLLDDFAAALAGWEWDIALLQEVPPWWPPLLAARLGAEERHALTSRNWLPSAQRWLGERFPDLLKSAAGGANVLLSRSGIDGHRHLLLRRWPERRVMHAARLACGVWVANLHASVYDPPRANEEIDRATRAALEWAGDAPLVVGGDFNVLHPRLPGFAHLGASKVDHLFARGLEAAGPARMPPRGHLSDHAPLAVALRPAG